MPHPETNTNWRKSLQYPLPVRKDFTPSDKYDIYPCLKLADNRIFTGFDTLAQLISRYKNVIIDGYTGVFFDSFIQTLEGSLTRMGFSVLSVSTAGFLKPEKEINRLTEPFLGGDDPLFGKRCTLDLKDFFELEMPESLIPDNKKDITIVYGPGAFLSGMESLRIYIDVPKNEIQYRARAGSIANLGVREACDPGMMYKRFYFVDWIVLNRHKKSYLPKTDIYIDGQHPDMPVWIQMDMLKDSLEFMANNVFRARPWFEPGAWGGSWIRDHIDGLNSAVVNYAWSFELISPENGLLLESSSILLEVSFDCIMFFQARQVLGECHEKFGTEFPIRFDFLDTFNGGNLSLQCHPRPEYMKENFGEDFTQEECYYILDNLKGSSVFLGFRDDIFPEVFHKDLERSFTENTPVEPEKYLLKHPASKHDFFLIPPGTIHGSGTNNLVLEISTTPYIFTFKMYDWLRPDLDGKPRPLNIRRGMDNLFFERKGSYVMDKLISKPRLTDSGPGWKLFHLPTHKTQLYDVLRYHFREKIEVATNNKCLVLSLVEGSIIEIVTRNGFRQHFCFAETFIIPAAAVSVDIFNKSEGEAILILAFVK